MSKKDKLIYISIIVVLVITLGVFWFLIVSTLNAGENGSSSSNGAPAINGGSSTSYSAAKEIASDENITSGEFSSSNADENAISASGNINATLSNITVTKTGDSDGGDNTSFYGTNSAIIAKGGANLPSKTPILPPTPRVQTASLAMAVRLRPIIRRPTAPQ